jgi:hypothetical protein
MPNFIDAIQVTHSNGKTKTIINTDGTIPDLEAIKAENSKQSRLQINSVMSKAVLRRKGYFDIMPLNNKRVLVVGSQSVDSNYFLWHDLIARGISFHVCTWTKFVENYNTDSWKSAYDIVIFGGAYLASDIVNPENVKVVIQDIITNNTYKFIQVAKHGMTRSGQTTAYWFADMGLDTQASGDLNSIGTDGQNVVLADANSNWTVMNEEITPYPATGNWGNCKGTGVTKLAGASYGNLHTVSAKGNWVCITQETTYYCRHVDIGKCVWYLRQIKSHPTYNRKNAKKYVAWGYDCDRTSALSATDNIMEVQNGRFAELSIVIDRLTNPAAAENYHKLQAQGLARIVSHSFGHFSNTCPKDEEWTYSIDALDRMGYVNDGIHYMTGNETDISVLEPPRTMGYLMCGYTYGLYGRNQARSPFGKGSEMLSTSIQMGGSPIFCITCSDDIYNMGTNGENAYNTFVSILQSADKEPISLPLVFYFHDSPLDKDWIGTGAFVNGGYFDIAVYGMERRKDYYRQVFNFIDSLGYLQIVRSEAIEYIADIMNCVTMISETITTSNVTVKYSSKRKIDGLTIAIPVDPAKTISNVKIESITIPNARYERSTDNKWLYVNTGAVPGKERTILVIYA